MPHSGAIDELDIDRSRDGAVEVISARGSVDIATAPLLSNALSGAIEDDAERIVVDLSGVDFIDSSGLHVLLNALRRLTRQRRALAIACIEESQVHRVLALADLVGTFSVHRTRESAVGAGDDLVADRRRARVRRAAGAGGR